MRPWSFFHLDILVDIFGLNSCLVDFVVATGFGYFAVCLDLLVYCLVLHVHVPIVLGAGIVAGIAVVAVVVGTVAIAIGMDSVPDMRARLVLGFASALLVVHLVRIYCLVVGICPLAVVRGA